MTDRECEIETSKEIMEMRNRIAELEGIIRNTKATDESFALLTLQLIEAKKIIRSLLTCCRNYPQENAEKMHQAEKFIKDSEVVK